MQGPVLFLAVFPLLALLAEYAWSRFGDREVYKLGDTLGNFSIMLGSNLLRPLALPWSLLILSLFEPLQLFRLPESGWAFLVTFLVTDFSYYWYHRLSHELPLLWTMHHTHHSSPWMNLTTAVRLNWIAKFVAPLFFAPLVLLGLPPLYVGLSLILGLLFQYPLHTRSIGRFGRFEGKLLNTPSAHRVHHGSNRQYIDKNYAGVLIIWDRLFGTYEPEDEPVRYGVTSGFVGHNPLVVQFQPLWKYMRGEWRREKHVAAQQVELQHAGT
jgi:sterol desaturase/sphingolipid hydroxylase (fatty acid hydroxylase superfamily)